MSAIFGVFFVVWIAFWSGIVPLFVFGLYLDNRDCRAKHGVETCRLAMIPEVLP
jgi:hypothetical protein